MPFTSAVRRRPWAAPRGAALLGYAAALALALTGLAAVPAGAIPGTTSVSGIVTGDYSELDESGIWVPLSACDTVPTDEAFHIEDCEFAYWYADGDEGFEIDDFPTGKYLVAGELDDPYADYEPGAVSPTPITGATSGLSTQLTARPDIDMDGVTTSLSPRQPIAGQSVTLSVSGLPAGATIDSYQWPGDVDQDFVDEAAYTVPASELDVEDAFFGAAIVVQDGHRRAWAMASSPYRVWASAAEGGVLQGTITDAGGVIDSAEDIRLSLCNQEEGTGIGVAGTDAYQVTRVDETHFAYEVIVPNGEYCLDAVIDYAGGQDHLLASSTDAHWVPVDEDYSAAEMFEVDGADDAKKAVTIDLDFVADGGSTGGGDEIGLVSAPTFSPGAPTVGQPFAMTHPPVFDGPVDDVTYTWLVDTGEEWTFVGSGNTAYTPTAQYIGKSLYLQVSADRGDDFFGQSFPAGVIAAAPAPPAKPAQAMPKGAVTKLPTTVTGVKKGKVKAGTKLKVKPPKVTLAGATVSYQWTLNGKPVSGATKKKFKTTKKQKGKKVGVIVTVSKPGYVSVVKTVKAGKVK